MKRKVSLEEISDGKLYDANDMVKANCHECRGCSACCHGMGNSIVLDPLDIHRIATGLSKSFDELLSMYMELHVMDSVILPNIRMNGAGEACVFLNSDERCQIHSLRPGICRLFPLGRYYENHGFRYFLQVNECLKQDRTKIKIKKWLNVPNIKQYEKYITDWHYFLERASQLVMESQESESQKNLNLYILQTFYRKSYDTERDFYEQFYERLKKAEDLLS